VVAAGLHACTLVLTEPGAGDAFLNLFEMLNERVLNHRVAVRYR
jgi:hypothetical protein